MTENLNIPSDDNLKNFNKIIGTLENSLKIDPKDHNLYISLGDEYLKLKRFDLAFKSYLSAYKLQPRNADISVCIGVFHREVGNYNDAASALLNAIKLNKNDLKTSPTPFDGRSVNGKILATFINGSPSYVDQMLKEKIVK